MGHRVVGMLGLCSTLSLLTSGCSTDAPPATVGPETSDNTETAASSLLVGNRFGAWCTRSYQNNYQVEQPHAWDLCGGFVGTLDNTATKAFYYDLNNKKYYWESGGDHQPANDSADDVDLLWVATHGGAPLQSTTASYAMWNYWVTADTAQMRLGDSAWWGGGLAILATYACEVLTNRDGKLVQRWAPALRGGLKMVLASHEDLHGGDTTDDCGSRFASYLQQGYSVRTSWRDGMIDWYVKQDPAIMATGATCNDCYNRRDSMTWKVGNFPFIRDNNIGCTCWYYWDEI